MKKSDPAEYKAESSISRNSHHNQFMQVWMLGIRACQHQWETLASGFILCEIISILKLMLEPIYVELFIHVWTYMRMQVVSQDLDHWHSNVCLFGQICERYVPTIQQIVATMLQLWSVNCLLTNLEYLCGMGMVALQYWYLDTHHGTRLLFVTIMPHSLLS